MSLILVSKVAPRRRFDERNYTQWNRTSNDTCLEKILSCNLSFDCMRIYSGWIQTRLFSKQYNCNVMGIAAISPLADLMSKLNLLYWSHNYLNGCTNAQIICQWLTNCERRADQFIVGCWAFERKQKHEDGFRLDNNLESSRNKDLIWFPFEHDFGCPSTSICTDPWTL